MQIGVTLKCPKKAMLLEAPYSPTIHGILIPYVLDPILRGILVSYVFVSNDMTITQIFLFSWDPMTHNNNVNFLTLLHELRQSF
jgi:hypothetical protein